MKIKKLVVTLALLLITGCSAEVSSWQINMAESKCENFQGVDKLRLIWNKVICNDGTQFDVMVINNQN